MIAPEDFLALAELEIQNTTEAEWRTAVSRAYYAAFHKARKLFLALGFGPPKGDQAHAYVWLRLLNCGNQQVQLAGSNLNSLRRYRNQADYDVDQNLSQANARMQVLEARQIIQILTAAATDPVRTQIMDTMKIYERDVLRQITWKP
jgi:uncharacterized protein (UPF0332 family)